ncbi:MAG: cytochrome c-type biogenesis protein CcmH [Myxococcales bacterium]|nr:cytochrome c-type biogenesis protein CcmH [Myxococcales bacterium]
MNHRLLSIGALVAAITIWLGSAASATSLSADKQRWLTKFESVVVCVCREGGGVTYKRSSIAKCDCQLGKSVYQGFKAELEKQSDEIGQLRAFFYGSLVKLVNTYQPHVLRGDSESDKAFLKQMAKLRCMCGDCPLRPLDECNCGFAQNWKRVMRVQFDAGESFEQMATFYAKSVNAPYDRVLTNSNKALSWVIPLGVAVLVLLVLGLAIRGWSKRAAANESTVGDAAPIDEAAQKRLRDAMRNRDMER